MKSNPGTGSQDEIPIDLLNKQDRVHRINDLNYNDLKAVFQHADLFVLPSAYEGFGLPVLEAMLAGIPVVTTERASLPEVVGDHAYFGRKDTPEGLAETIREALGLLRQEREKLILEGKSWARSFSWEKSAAQTIKVLHTLMSSLGNPGFNPGHPGQHKFTVGFLGFGH